MQNRSRQELLRYISLKRIADGLLPSDKLPEECKVDPDLARLLGGLHERVNLLGDQPCPADRRLEAFLSAHFADVQLASPLKLPASTLTLDRSGLARELSLPAHGDMFSNEYVSSYRVKNGVLHNPRADRRTTQGTFHVTEGGLPIAADKKRVPKRTFAYLFQTAFEPPRELMVLPFTMNENPPTETFVSLLIRPLVSPNVPGIDSEKRMEIRFFVPGGLISNLDFVESIFGNAGDPFLPQNDAALDVFHWTGHTGCVILAPHLCHVTKQAAGLPHFDQATPRQRIDGMCWQDPQEKYNEGQAFKLTCRTAAGVVVTLIADNYYGYCKKEVKTQISYSANLFGNAEEEHAGGTIAYPSFNLGDEFVANSRRYNGRTFDDVARDYAEFIDIHPEGYGVDKRFPDLIYIPEDARATLHEQHVIWSRNGKPASVPILPGKVYMAPSGYSLRMEKHPTAPTWRLIGTGGEGTFCHKPCTVSGGGKSEISKSLIDYMLYGPVFVSDLKKDLALVHEIFSKDYSNRWNKEYAAKPQYGGRESRGALDPNRSLGSLIKLLTPSTDYSPEYNAWLASVPDYIFSIVFIIKRFQRPDWVENDQWRKNFSVDNVNGSPGHELKYKSRKLVGDYLRVGFDAEQHWRTFKLRQDFAAAAKLATEDDISVSLVVPSRRLKHLNPNHQSHSFKFVANCELRLFQRPDDAVHRGLDKQAEADLARSDNFISNFEPLSSEQAREIIQYVVDLDKFTSPMQKVLREVAEQEQGYLVCSSMPRLVDGVPTKNPRYLQQRPDLANPMQRYVCEMATRLFRAVPADCDVPLPVNSVLFGRRNNPPEFSAGIRGLAVYNPLHYQELPELFMDFISSLTGKSPSTTGAGSEGALTKGPFNALLPIHDLNNALVSFLLTELAGFSTAAGHIGPNMRVDHDISYLIPEMWCRLSPEERDPQFLISQHLFEPLKDFEFQGELIPASRLGYRMTSRFLRVYFGRLFDNPAKVFDDAALQPETQDLAAFADGVKYVCEAHQRVAKMYFDDGSIAYACPPLKMLLSIMAEGHSEGRDLHHPEVRQAFTLGHLLSSDWYHARLQAKQQADCKRWAAHVSYLEKFIAEPNHRLPTSRMELNEHLQKSKQLLQHVNSPEYLQELQGMLGLDPALLT